MATDTQASSSKKRLNRSLSAAIRQMMLRKDSARPLRAFMPESRSTAKPTAARWISKLRMRDSRLTYAE